MKKNIKERRAPAKPLKRRRTYHTAQNGYAALLNSGIGKKIRKNVSQNDIALGLLTMGLGGAAAYMMLNAKKTKPGLYNNLKNKAEEYAHEAYDFATNYADTLKGRAEEVVGDNPSTSLLLAGTVGTLLGASAIYLLSRDSHSHDFKHKIMEIFSALKDTKEGSSGWMNTIRGFLESASERHEEDEDEDEHHENDSKLHHALEMGINGLSLIDSFMKKGRRHH